MDSFATYQSPVGWIIARERNGQICALERVAHKPVDLGQSSEYTDMAFAQLEAYFMGKRQVFDFPYVLEGTVFQQKVWRALLDIPYGETRSYGDIAHAIGNPKACRAVGMANHRNPMIIVVPCHRVIGANGALTGYGGGLPMKTFLLNLEQK